MSERLKPCPFCGGKAELVDYGTSGAYEVVQCSDCGVRTRMFDKSIKFESAVDAWNRRKADSCKGCKHLKDMDRFWKCPKCKRQYADKYEPERRTE